MRKIYIMLCLGFVVLATLAFPNAPTMDDWSYMTSPQTDNTKLISLLLPFDTYWRPFDGIIGYINGLHTRLFPLLNHIIIVTGHIVNCMLLYKVAILIGLRQRGTLSVMIFFMFSPGMLGTVLDIDSANQVYALLWGLVATLIYLQTIKERHNQSFPLRSYILFATVIFIGTLCKENAMAFIVVSPLLAYGTGMRSFKSSCRDIFLFLSIAVIYSAIRLSLPTDQVNFNTEYVDGGIRQIVRNIGMFIVFSWLPWDFVSILHAPSRNIFLAALTVLLSMPFIASIVRHIISNIRDRMTLGLLCCMVILAGIHLATIFTVMHTYSSLCIAALIIGMMMERIEKPVYAVIIYCSFLVPSAISDVHHAIKAYESGETGKQMARLTISQCGGEPDNVYVIRVDDGYPKYSMFCTIPADAFGNGIAVRHMNDYMWPAKIECTEIRLDEKDRIDQMVSQAFAQQYQSVWIVEGENVKVINQPQSDEMP